MSNLRFKVGDRAKVVDCKHFHDFQIGDEVEIVNIDGPWYECKSSKEFFTFFLAYYELGPIESLEEKTAKAFEEIANGTGPEMVVISAEEYANFQEMEKLLGKMFRMKVILEKLLKQKYNP